MILADFIYQLLKAVTVEVIDTPTLVVTDLPVSYQPFQLVFTDASLLGALLCMHG
ncbi:hypothetical protein D3C85_1731940 [compost metagenome]